MRTGVLSFVLMLGVCTSAVAGPAGKPADHAYRIVDRYRLGGTEGWDYLAVDAQRQRLFISRSDHVAVIDANSGKLIGEIPGTLGVHGIALAPDLKRGYTSNGRAGTVTAFDLDTLKVLDQVKVTGANPDAIVYDPATKRVFTFNGNSDNATAIDAASLKVVGTIALPGKPEFAVSDGHGRVYVNIEDKSELAVINPASAQVVTTWPLAPCEEPSGLAMDIAHQRLFSVCANHRMMVLDAQSGHRVAEMPIGEHPDAAAFDPASQLAFSSNGEGTLTIVHEDDADHFSVVANVPTRKSARTMALDTATHRIYLSSAETGPRPKPTAEQPHPRPVIAPDTFEILVLGQ
ncbi:MAG: YncE family protein [Stenotrophobium sp.]